MKKKSKKKKSSKLDVQTARAKTRLKRQLSVIESLDNAPTANTEAVPKSRKPLTDKELHYFIINTLRRASYRWPCRIEAFYQARVELPPLPKKDGSPGLKKRIMYKCAECKQLFTRKKVCADHIVPVVGPEGFTTWSNYVPRMFCPTSNFQILCKDVCHKVKSNLEQTSRRNFKKNQLNKINKLKETK